MEKIKISEMNNDDLRREYINIVISNKLEKNISKERREHTKIYFDEIKKRGLFPKTYRMIKELNIR